MSRLEDIFLGKPFDGEDKGEAEFAEGKITSISLAGIMFTIPTYDESKYVWGPAPYPAWMDKPTNDGGTGASAHTHVMVGPQVGDRCLILFPTGTTIDPWVIGWWPS